MTASIVVDSGAESIKAGFAGDACPSHLVPCALSHAPGAIKGQDVLVGGACTHSRSATCPIGGGMVTSFPDLAHIWDHTFYEQLCIEPDRYQVMVAESALSPASSKRKTLELLFEQFGFAGASLQPQPILTLYAQGAVSGLVVDCGHSISSVVAVVEGVIFPSVTKRVHAAGRQVSERLLELLQRRSHALSGGADLALAGGIKEKLCYVALDAQQDAQLAKDTTYLNRTYTLPDGRSLRMGLERCQAAEVLFDPSLIGIEGPGIAQAAFDAIQEMDMVNRRPLYEHVVLTGGTSMLRGLPTRVDKEMRRLFLDRLLHGDAAGLSRLRLKLSDPPNRKHLAWQGGAVLADMMQDQAAFWISRQEYEEDPHRALNKC